jgi:dTMP kinase
MFLSPYFFCYTKHCVHCFMFITFEGIDGCGKSTQAKLLEERLRATLSTPIVFVRDPGHTGISESIRAILLDKANTAMTARTELLLYSAARAQLVDTVIAPALLAGSMVLADRFTDSTIAYQSFGRGLSLPDIHHANAVATGGIVPNLTFFLDVPLHHAKERCADKNADRMELAGDEFFERVIAGYRSLAESEPQRVKRLDATLEVETLHEHIWSAVQTARIS